MKFRSSWQIISVISIALVLICSIDQTTKNALKVQHILKKIETHRRASNQQKQTTEVTQSELNDYIKYRLAKEKEAHIKGLKMVLLKNNQVRGNLRSDARPLNLSFLFGDILDFEFKGFLSTREGKARLKLSVLELNGQPIKPEMMDLILSAAAQYNGTKPIRLDDWYKLPKGIDRITVNNGKAILHY